MDKTFAEFVACCKVSSDTDKYLKKIYDRDYLPNENYYFYINHLLTEIVDEYCKVTAKEAIEKLSPQDCFGEDTEYSQSVRRFLISKIANTEVSKFPCIVKETILEFNETILNKEDI